MPTKPTQIDYEREILYWAVISLDAFGSALLRGDPHLDRWALYHNAPCKVFGPKYDPQFWWEADYGPIGQTERQAFSRAAKALEAAGLVVLVRQHGSRLSHIQPTAKGLAVALRLTPEANLAAVREAIKTAEWATPEHIRVIDAAAQEDQSDAS